MVNWENTEYVNPRQRKMKDLETEKIYTFEIQDDPDNIVKQSQTPVRAENLNKMQTDLVDDMSKDYVGTNITANTVEGYGMINKLYGDTVQTGTGDKSPDNPYKIECIGDDINLLKKEDITDVTASGITAKAVDDYVQLIGTSTAIFTLNLKEIISRLEIGKTYSVFGTGAAGTGGSFLFTVKYSDGTATKYVNEFTHASNVSSVIPYFQMPANKTVNNKIYIKVCEKRDDLVWSPYQKGAVVVKSSNSSNSSSNITYVNKPLCCLKDSEDNIVLQDYIDYRRGKIVRQCGYKKFNGSENWSKGGISDWQNKNYLFWTKIDDIAESNYNISNQFTLIDINTVVNNTSANYKFARYTAYSSSYNIVFLDKNSDSVETFKQKLAKNNMILVYKLTTPVEEDIECSDKIVQYADSTTIQSDAKVEVTLTNNKTINDIYEEIEKVDNGINTKIDTKFFAVGIGGQCKSRSGDWNTACGTVSGFYMGQALANAPDSSNWYFVIHLVHNASWMKQIAFNFTTNTIRVRSKRDGIWTAWE